MTPESIQRLLGYTYWGFDRVWDCIMELNDEQFTQDLPYSIGSIRNHIIHLASAELRWKARLQQVDFPPFLPYADYTTRSAARTKYDEVKGEVSAYIYSLNQAQLDEVIHYEIPNYSISAEHHRWELLLHLANHATDHRAQILAMLDHHFGAKTVEQDLVFYLQTK